MKIVVSSLGSSLLTLLSVFIFAIERNPFLLNFELFAGINYDAAIDIDLKNKTLNTHFFNQ